ncbi:MAG: hypothetical protein R3B71_04170 [Candidatus Gracilibacteria bacterium]
MSVYLSRSPYLASYGHGSRKKPLFKKRATRQRRLWDSSFFSGMSRVKKRSTSNLLNELKTQTKVGAAATTSVVRKSAETVTGMAHAMKNVGSKKVKFEIGPRFVIIGLMGMVAFLSFAYLAHFHTVATKGYELRRLEADRQQLLNQYEIKNMRLAEMQSLTTIVESEKANSMRRANQIEFVRGNSALASNP